MIIKIWLPHILLYSAAWQFGWHNNLTQSEGTSLALICSGPATFPLLWTPILNEKYWRSDWCFNIKLHITVTAWRFIELTTVQAWSAQDDIGHLILPVRGAPKTDFEIQTTKPEARSSKRLAKISRRIRGVSSNISALEISWLILELTRLGQLKKWPSSAPTNELVDKLYFFLWFLLTAVLLDCWGKGYRPGFDGCRRFRVLAATALCRNRNFRLQLDSCRIMSELHDVSHLFFEYEIELNLSWEYGRASRSVESTWRSYKSSLISHAITDLAPYP